MTITDDQLDSFASLATAIGLMRDGSPQASWFESPLGNAADAGFVPGLSTMLADDTQRAALVDFVDEVLGPPDRETDGGEVWVPLFAESDPPVTIHAVLTERPGSVRLGVGVEYEAGTGTPRVSTKVHVPIFQMRRRNGSLEPGDPSTPDWLLLGSATGNIAISLDVVLDEGTPPPGEAGLGGISLEVSVPTSASGTVSFSVGLERLQLPGAPAPTDVSLDVDSIDELGSDVLELILGLVRAQAEALDLSVPELRPFAALTGMLGLRAVADIPAFPLPDLIEDGIGAVTDWISQVLDDGDARDAWLGELADLVGATVDPATDSVVFDIGDAELRLGVRIDGAVNGLPVLTPWIELGLDTSAARGRIEVSADLFRLDTATGVVEALPILAAEAVFGTDAGGAAILTGDPGIGSVRLGVGLRDGQRPEFRLTIHDVTLHGRSYDVIDLSSPDAALDAANDVVDGALVDALDGLGPAGAAVATLLGLDPPPGITGTDAVALLADPLGALASYWDDLRADSAAMRAALRELANLLLGGGAPTVPGSGTIDDPWTVALAGPVSLLVHQDAGIVRADLAVAAAIGVFDDHEVQSSLHVQLLRTDLGARSLDVLTGAGGRLVLARDDASPLQLDLGDLSLHAAHVGVAVNWATTRGAVLTLEAPDLHLTAIVPRQGSIDVAIPLPTIDSTGVVTFAPDWHDVERAVGLLVHRPDAPFISALVELVGWVGDGPRLPLGDLIADPEVAVRRWAADLALDCDRVRDVLVPVSSLCNGLRGPALSGQGTARHPFRCAPAGLAAAPGLAVWLDPGCPPITPTNRFDIGRLWSTEPLDAPELAALLGHAGDAVGSIDELLVGRGGLADGLALLRQRWVGSDGLVVAPAGLPDGVTSVVLDGAAYVDLVAMGATGELLFEVLDPVPTAVVHVVTEASLLADRPAGTTFDAAATAPGSTPPTTVPATGDGEWFVRLPDNASAALARPDRDATTEQTERLGALLADRTDPVTVIAYGQTGAAVVRAAASVPAVDHIVTVGVPWGPLAVDSLGTGLGGDALRLLDVLRVDAAPDADAGNPPEEISPGVRARAVVARSVAALDATARPAPATGEVLRAGLPVTAVFGALDEDTVDVALGHLLAEAVDSRIAAAGATTVSLPTSLHAGISLPAIDLDIAGLLIGAGVTFEACRIERATGGQISASLARSIIVDVHLGVHDGWLVGGPGATQHDLELRWMSARVTIPLDARPASTVLSLHEARTYDVFRERWDIDPEHLADTALGTAVTEVVPEVRALLSQVIGRLQTAAPDVAALFGHLGLIRDGGLEPAALDRWVYDTRDALEDALAVDRSAIAAAVRRLVGDTASTGTVIAWTAGGTTLAVDIATGAVTGSATVAEPEAPTVEITVDIGADGAAVHATVGAADAARGSVQLVAGASTAGPSTTGGATLAVEVTKPGGARETLSLLDVADPAALAGRLATHGAEVLVAAVGARLVDHLRAQVTAGAATLDRALDLLGVLGPVGALGTRATVVPVGLVADPLGWLRHAVDAWRTNFAASAVGLLDAVGAVVVGAADGSWDLTTEFSVRYTVAENRLRILAHYTDDQSIGASTITTAIGAGLSIALDAPPLPAVDAAVSISGSGIRLVVDPTLRLDLLRPAPAVPVTLHPGGGSFGDVVAGAGAMVAPLILNELIDHRTDPPSLTTDVAVAVHALGDALDLLDADRFTAARLEAFAVDPGAALLARTANLVAVGLDTVVDALDPAGTLVRADQPFPGATRISFGISDGASITLDTSQVLPAVELACDVTIPGVGPVVVERIRITAGGAQIAARFGPAPIAVGPVTLFPLVVVRAGITGAGFSRAIGVGLASSATGASSLEFRWTLDAQPPQLVLVERTGAIENLPDDPVGAALQLLGWGVSLAGGIIIEQLGDLLTDAVVGWLRGVVFVDAAGDPEIDGTLFADLLDPEALLDRLLRLGWNLATVSPPSITIDSTVTIGLAATGSPGDQSLGINLSLVADKPFPIASGDTQVDLVVNAAFIDPEKPPGLTIHLLRGSITDLRIAPSVIVAGIGVRVSKNAGPLLDLGGVAIDAIAVHTYGEATSDGELGGGIELQLDGFAFSPAAGGGDNAIANGIMNDAGATGASNRPSFSPAVSVQIHPGDSGPRIGLRAGDPPGPWWLVVQRQLGPLYIERVGLDTVESGGRVTRVSLLFDGSISMFGLAAAVEQLSLNWNGGDLLDIGSWSVDLMGLAVSADLSGVYLAGGLLKTLDPPPGGATPSKVSYVGMLMGRFGVYGLSVFGGYTDDDGSPSFFIFGALNGPIGGPPAFFLTGIGGGLGINRGLRVPDDLSQFGEYPFIKALDPAASPSDDPMGELQALAAYFPPQSGNFWFAAGISFNSFALVDGVAVVAVSFGDGLDINLFGLARLALPRPQVALVSIELGILARFSTSEGLFLIQAQLTDNSWLLYPEVRLTGGFAMAIWWKGALAGQFVLTLGGYHPNFQRDGYPVVPRLGLEWRISNAIVIKGGSYFALTSEALMAGVDVEVSADWGWAWVRVAFGAHAIVFFDPFFFQAEVYARISAGITIDVWIGKISISISIGARIAIEGPDFSGKATFEIGPCELSVSFGDSHKERTPAIGWDEFVPKYLEDAGGGRARAISSITGRGTLPAATGGDTAAPSSDGTVDRPFEVFAEHEVVFVTTVPVTRFTVGSRSVTITPKTSTNTSIDLGVAPMDVDNVSSTLGVGLQVRSGTAWVSVSALTLNRLADGLAESSTDLATAHVRTDAFPIGVWGEAEDPDDKPLPKGDIVRAGNVLKLVAGIITAPVGPEIDYRQVEAGRRPLPLSATGSSRPAIVATSASVTGSLPTVTTAAAALDAARDIVFATDGTRASVSGLLARGQISETARRSFAADRTAPPRFGTLAGGITPDHGDRADVAAMEPPAPIRGRAPRKPIVIGHLAAGAGTVLRAPGTTVSDRRIKRRDAPSIESVRGRLGNELALHLDRTPLPGVERDDTVLLTSYPRTDIAGAAIGQRGGRFDAPHLGRMVAGLQTGPRTAARSTDTSDAIRSGDVIVIEQPDARIDVGASRPALAVDGRARVVLLRSNGRVVVDRTVHDEEVVVPPTTRLVAVHADPATAEPGAAGPLPGWHGRSRLARLAVRTALGAGCVVHSDAATGTPRTAWLTGHEVVTAAATVTTTFAQRAEVVAVVLDGVAPQDLDPLSIAFDGCRRRSGADGRDREPTVVLAGSQSVVLVAVDMDDDDAGVPLESFRVVVRPGGEWQIAGVLAGTGDLDGIATRIAEAGVDGVVARLLATEGTGCHIEWRPPNRTRRMPPDSRRGG